VVVLGRDLAIVAMTVPESAQQIHEIAPVRLPGPRVRVVGSMGGWNRKVRSVHVRSVLVGMQRHVQSDRERSQARSHPQGQS